MGKIQKLDWGVIEWIYEPEQGSSDHLKVGISVMYPKAFQPRHIHYGDEQFMYIISGHGWQKIGEEKCSIEPGKYFHISAGMDHETFNTGTEPIVKLLISLPAVFMPPKVAPDTREKTRKMESIDKKEFLKETVKELLRHNLKPLRVPLSIFDENHNPVYTNQKFPQYCKKCCQIEEKLENCEVYRHLPTFMPPYWEGASAYVCRHGLSLYVLPIVYEQELLGFIKTGHIRTSLGRGEEDRLLFNIPESTANGMVNMIHNIAESICSHYQYCRMQVKLSENARVLSDKTREEYRLQGRLKTTCDKILNLQINQHFLFNTLNTIAGMAVKENALNTYQAVGDLAQLFRYTLRENSPFVALADEISYVRNYTNLQKLRFKDQLEVVYEIPQELMESQEVPFNFLQPIVENCFKHGFLDRTRKMKIEIRAYSEAGQCLIQVKDNGCGIPKETMKLLRDKIERGNEPHGTSMVVRKLQSVYGNSFWYDVKSKAGEGTEVSIRIIASGGESR